MKWIVVLFLVVLLAEFQSIQAHEGHDHHDHGEEDKSDIVWTHSANLTKVVGVNFKWRADDPEMVTMEMSSKTRGYVSVGFCPVWKGTMEGCDIVVGWVDDHDSTVHLVDYHADSNVHPTRDTSQDYEVIKGKQDGWFTSITFRRKWNTGDKYDADLRSNKVQLIWSWNPEDVKDGIMPAHDKNTRGHTKVMISMKSPPPDNVLQTESLVSPPKNSVGWLAAAASYVVISSVALMAVR